jgi:hypothetical protein
MAVEDRPELVPSDDEDAGCGVVPFAEDFLPIAVF